MTLVRFWQWLNMIRKNGQCCLWTEWKLNGFRVPSLEFSKKSKKLAEFKLQELLLFSWDLIRVMKKHGLTNILTIFNNLDFFWKFWQFLTTFTIFTIFTIFNNSWQFLTIYDNFWQFMTVFDNVDKFYHFWQLRQFL